NGTGPVRKVRTGPESTAPSAGQWRTVRGARTSRQGLLPTTRVAREGNSGSHGFGLSVTLVHREQRTTEHDRDEGDEVEQAAPHAPVPVAHRSFDREETVGVGEGQERRHIAAEATEGAQQRLDEQR